MSLCNHFIISASSFSWWAVWLGSHDNKMVVAPKKWLLDTSVDVSDLVGQNWVRIKKIELSFLLNSSNKIF